MKTLPQTFTANGFVHEQLVREGMLVLYRRFKAGGGPEHYEVIKIRVRKGIEVYPSDGAEFIKDGWLCLEADDARAKFEELKGAVTV